MFLIPRDLEKRVATGEINVLIVHELHLLSHLKIIYYYYYYPSIPQNTFVTLILEFHSKVFKYPQNKIGYSYRIHTIFNAYFTLKKCLYTCWSPPRISII
jgi:hypothetical protein